MRYQPDTKVLGQIERCAMELTSGAGQILLSRFGRDLNVEFKNEGRSDPVSDLDKENEAYLKAGIREKFPDHAIIGEETTDEGPSDAEYIWALDPLDGTVNYINGLPIYAVSVGVTHRGIPVVGCIWLPFPSEGGGQLFHARWGSGAWRDDKPIRVRANPAPQPGQITIFPKELRQVYRKRAGGDAPVGEYRGLGSIAYEMALTACGVIQHSLFSTPQIWDVVAGMVLIREAGGTVLSYDRFAGDWEYFQSYTFADPSRRMERMRKWSAPILVGNEELVVYLHQFLRPGRLRRFLKRLGLA